MPRKQVFGKELHVPVVSYILYASLKAESHQQAYEATD